MHVRYACTCTCTYMYSTYLSRPFRTMLMYNILHVYLIALFNPTGSISLFNHIPTFIVSMNAAFVEQNHVVQGTTFLGGAVTARPWLWLI